MLIGIDLSYLMGGPCAELVLVRNSSDSERREPMVLLNVPMSRHGAITVAE